MKADCIFCKIVAREVATSLVYEDAQIMAFDDIQPQAPVHVVFIPKEHIESVSQVSEQQVGLVGNLILAAVKIAKQKGISDSGYRIVINCNRHGGQAVFHLHLHLLGGRQMSWPPG